MTSNKTTAAMPPLRTWTIDGETPITLAVYRPAVTIRFGDGPEATIHPDQVEALSSRFEDLDYFFEHGTEDDLGR